MDEADFEESEEGTKPAKQRTEVRAEDDEQAEWLAKAFGQRVRYDHTGKRWHMWGHYDNEVGKWVGGHRWAPDKTKEVQRVVMDVARDRLHEVADDPNYSKTERDLREKKYRKLLDVNATERALLALSTRGGYKTDGSDWDQDENLLGCENGIVDLRENSLVENPGPETLVTRTTGHRFVPFEPEKQNWWAEASLRASRFMRFLDEVTSNDRDLGSFFLLWFGYSLFGNTREQRFLILTGLGRNGKGKLVETMRRVFGEYSADANENLYMRSRMGAARSDGARADLMALKGRRMAAMSEPDGGQFNEEMLKAHTGGDPITARALYSNDVISWEPTHSITFLTNDPPKVNDIGPSMAARVMVADFRERFEGPKEDKKLGFDLQKEAEGILAILCWAAKVWHQSPAGLVVPDRILRASAEYLTSNDPIGPALDEAFVIAQGAQAYGKVLHDAYLEWHARSDVEGDPLSGTAFGLLLSRKGLKKKTDKRGTLYLGIRPKSAIEVADEV